MNESELLKKVELKKKILAANDEAARALRRRFADPGTLVVDLISSPGSGKTSLLEATVRELDRRWHVAAVVGDVATELDAERLRDAGLPARQISTGGACHLEARLVAESLDAAQFGDLDVLFIENVGNLICPTSFDLGEDFKVGLLSVTEGHDKPFKYPGIFSKAAVTLITKADLLPHVAFDLEAAREQVLSLNPRSTVLVVSAKTGDGLDAWLDLLEQRLRAKRSAHASV